MYVYFSCKYRYWDNIFDIGNVNRRYLVLSSGRRDFHKSLFGVEKETGKFKNIDQKYQEYKQKCLKKTPKSYSIRRTKRSSKKRHKMVKAKMEQKLYEEENKKSNSRKVNNLKNENPEMGKKRKINKPETENMPRNKKSVVSRFRNVVQIRRFLGLNLKKEKEKAKIKEIKSKKSLAHWQQSRKKIKSVIDCVEEEKTIKKKGSPNVRLLEVHKESSSQSKLSEFERKKLVSKMRKRNKPRLRFHKNNTLKEKKSKPKLKAESEDDFYKRAKSQDVWNPGKQRGLIKSMMDSGFQEHLSTFKPRKSFSTSFLGLSKLAHTGREKIKKKGSARKKKTLPSEERMIHLKINGINKNAVLSRRRNNKNISNSSLKILERFQQQKVKESWEREKAKRQIPSKKSIFKLVYFLTKLNISSKRKANPLRSMKSNLSIDFNQSMRGTSIDSMNIMDQDVKQNATSVCSISNMKVLSPSKLKRISSAVLSPSPVLGMFNFQNLGNKQIKIPSQIKPK